MILQETRNTLQKTLILQAARNLNHPSADEIYQTISEDYPSVSRGTVYRNLNRLAESGELAKVVLPDTAVRFDDTLKDHYHIYCRICGRVDDVAVPYQASLTESIQDTRGYKVEWHDISLRGICPECLKADKT